MSRTFRRRLIGLLAAATALTLSGGDAAILATSGGSASSALTASAVPPQLRASRSPAGPGDPGSVPPTAATSPPGVARLPKVTENAPPVVDGVRRTNVASAHSPETLRLLSSSAATMPPPTDAGALGVDVADYQHPHGAAISWSRVAAAG
jgi:hypothetical protein